MSARFTNNIKIMVFLSIFFAVFGFCQHQAYASENHALVEEIHSYIEQFHVDGKGFEMREEETMDAMFQRLGDPFTYWLSSDEFIRFMEQIKGDYEGIGVRLLQIEEGVLITEVFPESPAEKAGIQRGDWIKGIEGLPIEEMNIAEVQRRLTEKRKQDKLNVVLDRAGQSVQVQVGQGDVHIPPIRVERLEGNIDYIEVRTFSEEAALQFTEAIERLAQLDGNGLVIDLRNNSGGLLQVIEHFAKPFQKEGALYHLQDREQEQTTYVFSDGTDWNRPIVLLVNRNSASAAELFAGFMQDYELAVIVGEPTFGKGSIQQLFSLSDDSVLRLTTRRYLTPASHQVDQVGIQPDLTIESPIGQTVMALRQLGVNEIKVSWSNEVVEINGAPFPEYIPVVEEGEHQYLPSRTLADLLGAEVRWIHDEKAVILERNNGEQIRFDVHGSDMILQSGQSFLNISSESLNQAGLHMTETGGLLVS